MKNSAAVRALLPEIEQLRSQGYTLKEIHIRLNTGSYINCAYQTFANSYYKARKQKQGCNSESESASQALAQVKSPTSKVLDEIDHEPKIEILQLPPDETPEQRLERIQAVAKAVFKRSKGKASQI